MAEDDRVEEGSEEFQPLPSCEQLWPPISYWSRAAAAVVVVVMAVLALAALRNVLLVVVAAFVIALGLQPALTGMERRGLRRGSAMAVIVLGGLILAAGAAAAIVPTVVGQAATAFERLPELISDLESRSPLMANLLDQVDLGGAEGEPGAIGVAGSVAQGIFFTITLLLLTPYFAVAFPAMKSGMFRLLRADHRADYVYVINHATELTSNYIVGNLTISLVAGVVTFIGLAIIGVPYALALAVWVAIADLSTVRELRLGSPGHEAGGRSQPSPRDHCPHDRWDAGRHSRRIAGVADRRPGQDLGNGVLDPEADREGQDRKSRRQTGATPTSPTPGQGRFSTPSLERAKRYAEPHRWRTAVRSIRECVLCAICQGA